MVTGLLFFEGKCAKRKPPWSSWCLHHGFRCSDFPNKTNSQPIPWCQWLYENLKNHWVTSTLRIDFYPKFGCWIDGLPSYCIRLSYDYWRSTLPSKPCFMMFYEYLLIWGWHYWDYHRWSTNEQAIIINHVNDLKIHSIQAYQTASSSAFRSSCFVTPKGEKKLPE